MKKILIVLLSYVAIAFFLVFGIYYFQISFNSVIPYVLLSIMLMFFLYYLYKNITKDIPKMLIIVMVMLVLTIPIKFLSMSLFDLYLFTNKHVRTKMVKQVAIKFVDAIERSDKSILEELSPKDSEYCEEAALRMADSAYADYYGKDLKITNITVTPSNHEDVDSFSVDFKYSNGSSRDEGKISGVTKLINGRVYICGESF